MVAKPLYNTKNKKVDEEEIVLHREKQGEYTNYLASIEEEQTLQFLQTRFREMDSARPDEDWDLRYKQFMSFLVWREDGKANVNLPIEYATIENKMSDELSQKPLVTLLATEANDVHKTNVMKKIWDFVWTEADTDQELYDLFLCKNIFGTAVWFEGLHKEIRTRFVPKMGKNGKIEQESVIQERSWLKGFCWDIRYVWIDPVNKIEEAKDCFLQEINLSYDDVKGLADDPNYNKEAVEAYISRYNQNMGSDDDLKYKEFVTSEEEQSSDNEKFALIHYYNKEKGKYIVTDYKFTYILRDSVNPYPHGELPISILVDHKNYKSIYGRGECELLENTKYERNTIRNQLLDLIREANTRTLAVGSNVQFEDMELINGVVRKLNFTGNLSDAQYLQTPSADSGLFNLDELLKNDATWITGIDNNALAGAPQKTAFEAKLQEQIKLKRIYLSLRLADFFYTRMARQRLANIQFFLPYTTGKSILGEFGASKKRTLAFKDSEITPINDFNEKTSQIEEVGVKIEKLKGETAFLELDEATIKNNLDVQVTTPTTTPILRELNKQELQELFQTLLMLAQVPQGQKLLEKFNMEEYFTELVKAKGYDVDRFIEGEQSLEEQKDLRQEMLEDMPLPSKPVMKTPGQQKAGSANPMQSIMGMAQSTQQSPIQNF